MLYALPLTMSGVTASPRQAPMTIPREMTPPAGADSLMANQSLVTYVGVKKY